MAVKKINENTRRHTCVSSKAKNSRTIEHENVRRNHPHVRHTSFTVHSHSPSGLLRIWIKLNNEFLRLSALNTCFTDRMVQDLEVSGTLKCARPAVSETLCALASAWNSAAFRVSGEFKCARLSVSKTLSCALASAWKSAAFRVPGTRFQTTLMRTWFNREVSPYLVDRLIHLARLFRWWIKTCYTRIDVGYTPLRKRQTCCTTRDTLSNAMNFTMEKPALSSSGRSFHNQQPTSSCTRRVLYKTRFDKVDQVPPDRTETWSHLIASGL